MQIGNTASNERAFGVVPRSRPDAAARIYPSGLSRGLSAEIGMPSVIPSTRRGGKVLANPVGAIQPAEIARPRDGAGDKERHWMLRSRRLTLSLGENRGRAQQGDSNRG